MTKRICIMTGILLVLFGLTLMASGSLSGSWMSEITSDPGPGGRLIDSFETVLIVDYTIGGFTATSYSELEWLGFIWQEFDVVGELGAFEVQANTLFGPHTADYIYTQFIGSLSIAGVDLGFYFAQLSDAVVGGPADGFAIRAAGSIAAFDVVSITEFGAQIKDDDFDGITIVHAGTGMERSFITDPLVVGQGFTGQKITLSGLSFSCVEDVSTTLYMTCDGFDFLKFETEGIVIPNLPWVTLGATLNFTLQEKTLELTPTFVWGDMICADFDLYMSVGTAGDHLTLSSVRIEGIALRCDIGGVNFTGVSFWGGGTKPLLLEDTEYWEYYQIKTVDDSCCGPFSFDAAVFFKEGGAQLFDVALFDVNMSVKVASQFTFDMGIVVDVETGAFTRWTFGFLVEW